MTNSKTGVDSRSNSLGGHRPYLPPCTTPSSNISQSIPTHQHLSCSAQALDIVSTHQKSFLIGACRFSTNNPIKFIKSPPSLSPAIISYHFVNGQPRLAAFVVDSPGVRVLRRRKVVRESTLPEERRQKHAPRHSGRAGQKA